MARELRPRILPRRLWSALSGPNAGPTPRPPENDRAEAERFLLRLARALHVYGTPAHRLEEALYGISDRLGVEGDFLVSPTSILVSFGEIDQQRTRLIRVDAGEMDLAKLAELHEIIHDVTEGSIGAAEASSRVDAIRRGPARWGPLPVMVGFSLSSGAVARIFDGGWVEMLASFVVGLAVGMIAVLGRGSGRTARLIPSVAGLVAAVGAAAASPVAGAFSPIVLLSSLIVLVPGLAMTLAMNELAHGHVVSGTARLSSALVTFLQIGFGAALGHELYRQLDSLPAPADPIGLPAWTLAAAMVPLALSLTVLFQARPKDFFLILPMVFVSFFASRGGSGWLGPELGVALGALALGVSSNALARWRDVPTAIPLVPGLLPLVPGSLGLRSLQALIGDDVVLGMETATGVALIAVGLVSGLFLANVVVLPRRLL